MFTAFSRAFAFACFLGIPIANVAAASADEAWGRIVALDAGPQLQTRNAADARVAAMAHLDTQETTLRKFIAEYGRDAHAFEARLRLARLLQIRADIEGNSKSSAEAAQLLDDLEKRATPEQKTEVDFARITHLMRTLRKPGAAQRDRLLNATRRFQIEHPTDRRVGPLLAEVSTLFAAQPQTMRSLLLDAQPLVTDPQLKAQINDDLKRLEMIGQPLTLRFATLEGKTFDLEEVRGSVVMIVFFAVWSAQSVAALERIRSATSKLPAESLRFVGVSLDAKTEALSAMLKEKSIKWPIGYDGKGWESPLIRRLGINALPTVWLVDRQGRLRSIDAFEESAGQAQQLLREK